MATLLLRLSAPLQSWGIDSKFNTRNTAREPSKSGVIGMIAAALGRKRYEDNDDLCELKFGVRVDHEGKLLRDYHTVHKGLVDSADITTRYYLADAVFLVGLEHENINYLRMLEKALHEPVYPLFLGRRSCPPTLPVSLGIRDCSLMDAFKEEKWILSVWQQKQCIKEYRNEKQIILRVIIDDSDGMSIQKDVPVSFNPVRRQHGYRKIREQYLHLDDNRKLSCSDTLHDAMSELEV